MYIAFEGIGGVGKSTQIKIFTGLVSAAGLAVALFREPGGTAAGERLRELLLNKELELSPRSQLLLFAAARFQLMPAIAAAETDNCIVVTDRCVATSYAYQGAAMGVPPSVIESAHSGLRWPDVIVRLHLNPAEAVRRRRSRDDRYQKDVEFMTAAARGYSSLPLNSIMVDVAAAGDPLTVAESVYTKLMPHVPGLPAVNIPLVGAPFVEFSSPTSA